MVDDTRRRCSDSATRRPSLKRGDNALVDLVVFHSDDAANGAMAVGAALDVVSDVATTAEPERDSVPPPLLVGVGDVSVADVLTADVDIDSANSLAVAGVSVACGDDAPPDSIDDDDDDDDDDACSSNGCEQSTQTKRMTVAAARPTFFTAQVAENKHNSLIHYYFKGKKYI